MTETSFSIPTGKKADAETVTAKVAVVIANYNTADALAELLFSLFRVAGRARLARVVVVDNGSTDESRVLLESLIEAGLVEGIFNRRQAYHGPALNQALDYLAVRRKLAVEPADEADVAWILDSDTIVLRRGVIEEAVLQLRETGAGILGHMQFDALPEGYIHPCAMFLDLQQTFLPGWGRFDNTGAPATLLHRQLRQRQIPIQPFPILSEQYVLHVGRRTRRKIRESGERTNRHFLADEARLQPHYHNNPRGAAIHAAFRECFTREVPQLSPEAMTAACLRTELLQLTLPEPHSPSNQEGTDQ